MHAFHRDNFNKISDYELKLLLKYAGKTDSIHSESFFPKILGLVLVNYFAVAFLVAPVQPLVLTKY